MKHLSLLLLVSFSLFSASWETALEKLNNPLISQSTRDSIIKEHQTFSLQRSPKIADPCIKSINIVECNEHLVNVTQANAARISIMTDEEATQAYPPSEQVDPRAHTFSIMMHNRLLLLVAATEAGLTNYHYEFWHFSLGDRYAAWFNNLPIAMYGLAPI